MGAHKSRNPRCTDEFPYTVITDDIEDVMDTPQLQEEKKLSVSPPKYQLVSICNKEARTSLMLSPAHGKHVFALAVITSVQDNTLFAETVKTIQKDEKDSLSVTMRQEMAWAIGLMKHASVGITTPWNDAISPLAAPRCRSLGKNPTGPQLDPMESTSTKISRPG